MDANPRGPNQPMKATDGSRSRVPSSASATGSIRSTVSADTANASSRHPAASHTSGTAAMPKVSQTA